MFYFFILTLLALVFLLLSGDLLIKGAVGVAERLGVPKLIVGLTIVAFGTSAPELVISIRAVLDGVSGLAIGNVVGSNIANVLLVLGLPAAIFGLPLIERGIRRTYLIMLGSTLLFVCICFFWELNFQTVIKSAASAASPTAWGAPGRRLGWRETASIGAPPKPSGRLR